MTLLKCSSSSSSYSVLIRCCTLSRDSQIYPIPSATARSLSLHFARLRAFTSSNQSSLPPPPLASSRYFLVVLAFSCHSSQDPDQLSEHYCHPSSAHVPPFAVANWFTVSLNPNMSICFSKKYFSNAFGVAKVTTIFVFCKSFKFCF